MTDWQARVDAVWASAGELGDDEVVRRIDALAAERPAGDPLALFERAGARDRSEERRVGKECGYQCRSRWSPYH